MACGPRRVGGGRAAALGLGEESRPVPSSGMTGGSPASEREKGGKGRSGLGREMGRRGGFWAAGKGKRKRDGLGWKGGRKRKGFVFSKTIQTLSI